MIDLEQETIVAEVAEFRRTGSLFFKRKRETQKNILPIIATELLPAKKSRISESDPVEVLREGLL